MDCKLGDWIARHTAICREIERLIESEIDLAPESIVELDISLDANFRQIMSMNLSGDSERLERIRFAIAEITTICENGTLAKTLTDCIYEDSRHMANEQTSTGDISVKSKL